MIFEIKDESLQVTTDYWEISELKLENYIVSLIDDENRVLDENVFGEELLYIKKQIHTTTKKRADLLFMDKNGDAVIIELKKDEGKLGVETQALQYLADFSNFQGNDFIKKFCKDIEEDVIKSFIYDDVDLELLNSNSRIILVARNFDPTLFSMGKWFAENNISFRCVSYMPLKICEKKYINFSVKFDQLSKHTKYKIQFSMINRKETKVFWHIIGDYNSEWWNYLIEKNQISASFSNQPGDKGEYTLKKYIKGDKILAYASKIGLIGYGEIENTKYELIKKDSDDDILKGLHRHRLSCKWKFVIKDVSKSIPPYELKKYNVHHPFQTSSEIKNGDKAKLIESFKRRSIKL